MSEQTTFTDADRNDGVEPDMVDQNAAPASEATGAGVVPMNMIQALNSAIDVKMAEDANVLSFKDAPFSLDDPRRDDGQCFNGKTVVGMSRAGDTLYLQEKTGRVFRMKVVDDCPALDGADKVDVRSDGAQVCSGVSATLRVKTATGFKSCRVNYVRRVNGADVATR